MKTVRKSVFETNSSSTHSVTVGTVGVNGTTRRDSSIVPNDEGVIELPKGPCMEDLGNSPVDKAAMLFEVATMLGQVDVVTDAIKEFTGATGVTSEFVPNDYLREQIKKVDLTKSFDEHMEGLDTEDCWDLPGIAGLIETRTGLGESSEYADEESTNLGQAKIIYEVLQDKEKIKDFIFCSKVRFYHTESYDG